MKFYSTKTNRMFDTIEELEASEKAYDEKQKEAEKAKAERSAAAKKVEDLYRQAEEAKKKADASLNDFCKKYGSYHMSVTQPSKAVSVFDILDNFPFWF